MGLQRLTVKVTLAGRHGAVIDVDCVGGRRKDQASAMCDAKTSSNKIRAIIPMLVCRNGASEIDFCAAAFGAAELSRRFGPDGSVIHATLKVGEVMLMVHGEYPALAELCSPSQRSARRW